MLLEALERFILDKTPTGYCLVNSDGSVRWVNTTLQEHLGDPINHIDEMAPEVSAWISSRIEYAIETQDPSSKTIFFQDWGTLNLQPLQEENLVENWLLSLPTLNSESGRERLFYETVFKACPIPMFVEDFSAVHQFIEKKREEGIIDFRAFFERNPESVKRLTELVIVKDINPSVSDVLKMSREAIVGRLSKTIHESTIPAFLEELVAIAERKPHLEIDAPVDVPNKNIERSRIYVQFPEDPKDLTNVFVTIVDLDPYVAERRSLEEQKEHALAANRSKSEFVATLGHEMRTPLNGIIGFAELLKDAGLGEECQEFVESIQSCSKTLRHLIDDVLDFTKIEAGEMKVREKPFSMKGLGEDVIKLFKHRISIKGLDFQYHLDPEVDNTFHGDPVRISQILRNLLSNAEKFTSKGSISLHIRDCPEKNEVQFLVIDTGIGIDKNAVGHVFQPYHQAETFTFERHGGTGLGLAISLRFAEMMGGRLRIEPGIPKGTVGILELPLARAKSYTIPEEDAIVVEEAAQKPLQVLAVDDNDVNLKLISYIFKHRDDITVKTAYAGQDALDCLSSEQFDAVLMDLQMPGMDGFQVTEAIRSGLAGAQHRNIPIAALTAYTTEETRERAFEIGIDAFIAKPMKPKEVLGFLRKVADGAFS